MSETTTTPVADTVTAETTTVATEAKKKPGRPVVEGSKRQAKLAARAEKEANGESVKRGRPTVEGSKRQERLAKQAERKASGVEIKPGRPKGSGVKVEVPAETPASEAPAEAATV